MFVLVSATISMTAFYAKHNNDPNQQSPLALDDSIEEMTSMLIDDTAINQLTGEPGKRLSKLGSAKVLPQLSRQGFFHDKALPRLPRLSFDSEDDWTTASRPAITAAVGTSNKADLMNNGDELDSCPPPVSRQPAHARKSSAPPLPRKSSKRRSRQREPKDVVEARNTPCYESRKIEPRKLNKPTQQTLTSPYSLSSQTAKGKTPKVSPDVSQQIEAMLATSKALKQEGDQVVSKSPALSKKTGMKGNRVLSKMRDAISGHLQEKGLGRHHNIAKDDHLLDPNLSQLPDYDDEASTISAMELRINEGW